ncbi:DarT ssDNA thymidine ADP-ribosyltransferase family protein [Gordonia sp. Z-3]|uniref:DarT ssDNA thymidine ADP-ribosyltransferase family protein n=1 Tax=Gordonia sp. Z-3 TaxID=3115408 RepID=UPI002E27D7F9|nr:DarT ssDNA thymidine ADP-ribosyltransferase family protein [Gordonia sp. Z-3]MED5801671.1 DarT ssDNA thymidine ADP-ribosyltransferase family protein [Gordonia sp. Z-3]
MNEKVPANPTTRTDLVFGTSPISYADMAEAFAALPATRLVHFTPALNLYNILRDEEIRPSDDLKADEQLRFTPTDNQRVDGHPGYVCCSFEYPNAYYQARARAKKDFVNYEQWVCLTLSIKLVLRDGVLFYPCNAARERGQLGGVGPQRLVELWANPSIPASYPRRTSHHPAVPTDLQAEVQIPGAIPVSLVTGIVAKDASQCEELHGLLVAHGLNPERFKWSYAPQFYDAQKLAAALQSGYAPTEHLWRPSAGGSS